MICDPVGRVDSGYGRGKYLCGGGGVGDDGGGWRWRRHFVIFDFVRARSSRRQYLREANMRAR